MRSVKEKRRLMRKKEGAGIEKKKNRFSHYYIKVKLCQVLV